MAIACAAGAASTVSAAAGWRLSPPPRLNRSSLHHLPPRWTFSSFKRLVSVSASNRLKYVTTRASSSESEETSNSVEVGEAFTELKEKWDAIEDKSSMLLYGTGAIVAVWLSSVIVTAINSLPLLPTFMEAVGLGYTGWFVYRYLLFKSSRKELASEIDTLKRKISGRD